MLNEEYKKQVIKDLQKIDKEYTIAFQKAINNMERLQMTRECAVKTIQSVERYVVILANRPRDFATKMGEIRIRYIKYKDACREIRELEEKRCEQQILSGGKGVGGVLGGVGVAALAPTAAMSVAMTFGTASTGTAIATLSGAAATNAALAWLGGGTLAAGGAGMAGGSALLGLAGPVGWAIGGLSLGGCLMAINQSNKEIARKMEESIVAIKKEIERIKEIDVQVLSWNKETKNLSNAIMRQLNRMKVNRKRDYKTFTEDEMNELVSLFNSTEVLSKKIGETIKGRS